MAGELYEPDRWAIGGEVIPRAADLFDPLSVSRSHGGERVALDPAVCRSAGEDP